MKTKRIQRAIINAKKICHFVVSFHNTEMNKFTDVTKLIYILHVKPSSNRITYTQRSCLVLIILFNDNFPQSFKTRLIIQIVINTINLYNVFFFFLTVKYV